MPISTTETILPTDYGCRRELIRKDSFPGPLFRWTSSQDFEVKACRMGIAVLWNSYRGPHDMIVDRLKVIWMAETVALKLAAHKDPDSFTEDDFVAPPFPSCIE